MSANGGGEDLDILQQLGFKSDTFSEVILILDLGGRTHIQPLGVKLREGFLWARVFKPGRLYGEVRPGLKGSLNITHDPRAFFEPVMRRSPGLEISWRKGYPFLSGSEAVVLVEITSVEEKGDLKELFLKPLEVDIRREMPLVFNRAFPALLEALICLTRIRYHASLGHLEEARSLFEKMLVHLDSLRHATSDSGYLQMAEAILCEAREHLQHA